MAGYAYVSNGKVEEEHYFLPRSWKNISNLEALSTDAEFLRSLGWLPLTQNIPSYNPETQTLEIQYNIHPYFVEKTGIVTDKPNA